MNNDDIKLTGYVLRNEKGELLTKKKGWRGEDETGGWIWSEEEVARIVRESTYRPTHKQVAFLSRRTGLTVITGPLEKI